MEERKHHRRLSVLSDLIIFLFVVLLSLGGLKLYFHLTSQDIPYNETSSLISEDKILNITEENKKMVKQMQEQYHITVLYGKDVKNYAPMVEGVEQTDDYVVNNNLHIIAQSLEKYPSEIFSKVSDSKHPIYIMLLDHFENNNLALAARNNLNEYKIYVSNTAQFERAFHHEMYHVIEYAMSDKESYLFASWYRYNPNDFKYRSNIETLEPSYVYGKDLDNRHLAYFVSLYAKSAEKEDRAEIFTEAMMAVKRPTYLKEGEPIRLKLNAIMEEIKENMTVQSFYFDKFLI